jgi:hypothetical protein
MPYSTIAHVYTLADPLQPAYTYKSMKNGKLQTKLTVLGKLPKLFDRSFTRPNTYLFIAYKIRGKGPILKRGK